MQMDLIHQRIEIFDQIVAFAHCDLRGRILPAHRRLFVKQCVPSFSVPDAMLLTFVKRRSLQLRAVMNKGYEWLSGYLTDFSSELALRTQGQPS